MYKTLLVNKDNPMKNKDFKKLNLVELYNYSNERVLIDREALQQFLKLKDFLMKRNFEIEINSAFRSIEEQESIQKDFLERYGEDYCRRIVAEPYTSEHHTGLGIDFLLRVDGSFAEDNLMLHSQSAYYEQVHKYLKDFGFILRYPKGKEEVTGYSYEPWHIRYVGLVPAKIIYERNWTLEEYTKYFQGILVLNKKKGMTSFDVVNEISYLFGTKRVGHTGTLDPLAEGVLIVALGKATKVVELITSSYKEYIAEAKLGISTDTLDITGKVVLKEDIPDNIDIPKAFLNFPRKYLQEVPKYAAVKVNGKKLYEYARNNEDVELPKREVTIKDLELLNYTHDTFTFRAVVSKGTYIRSLIKDIGTALNTAATMTKLTRTKQAGMSISDANDLDDIKNNNYKLYNIDDIIDLPVYVVNADLEFKIKNGIKILNEYDATDKVIFKNKDNEILGIYEVEGEYLKVWKNF